MTETTRMRLGELYITPGANARLHVPDVVHSLTRHARGDFGVMSEEDQELNREAMATGDRVMSAYLDKNGTKFWIITEGDRYCTTILLPEEY